MTRLNRSGFCGDTILLRGLVMTRRNRKSPETRERAESQPGDQTSSRKNLKRDYSREPKKYEKYLDCIYKSVGSAKRGGRGHEYVTSLACPGAFQTRRGLNGCYRSTRQLGLVVTLPEVPTVARHHPNKVCHDSTADTQVAYNLEYKQSLLTPLPNPSLTTSIGSYPGIFNQIGERPEPAVISSPHELVMPLESDGEGRVGCAFGCLDDAVFGASHGA